MHDLARARVPANLASVRGQHKQRWKQTDDLAKSIESLGHACKHPGSDRQLLKAHELAWNWVTELGAQDRQQYP
eukprot:7425160-Pyramimonas_sp.AAC.1